MTLKGWQFDYIECLVCVWNWFGSVCKLIWKVFGLFRIFELEIFVKNSVNWSFAPLFCFKFEFNEIFQLNGQKISQSVVPVCPFTSQSPIISSQQRKTSFSHNHSILIFNLKLNLQKTIQIIHKTRFIKLFKNQEKKKDFYLAFGNCVKEFFARQRKVLIFFPLFYLCVPPKQWNLQEKFFVVGYWINSRNQNVIIGKVFKLCGLSRKFFEFYWHFRLILNGKESV